MRYYIAIIILFVTSYAYAIKVGNVPILNKGIRVGYGNVGTSSAGGGELPDTYWYTAYGTDWTVAYGLAWTETYNTEIP